jgi:hypothetical protein
MSAQIIAWHTDVDQSGGTMARFLAGLQARTAALATAQEGLDRLSWSPVSASSSWDEALVMARAMTATSRAGAHLLLYEARADRPLLPVEPSVCAQSLYEYRSTSANCAPVPLE